MAKIAGPRALGVVAIFCFVLGICAAASVAQAVEQPGAAAELAGLWRGTSACTNRVAAPACQDETVVYEFLPGRAPGIVRWIADKVVNGQREPMGELELKYNRTERCWKAEFNSPRTRVEWRLTVDGVRLTGTGRLLPQNENVRKLELRKE